MLDLEIRGKERKEKKKRHQYDVEKVECNEKTDTSNFNVPRVSLTKTGGARSPISKVSVNLVMGEAA